MKSVQLNGRLGGAGTPPQKNNSALVQRLLDSHGVVMGKTRMHELAYGVTSINPVFGPVLNPYDVTKIPGGATPATAKNMRLIRELRFACVRQEM